MARVRTIEVFGTEAVAVLSDPYSDHIVVRKRTGPGTEERHTVSSEMPLRVELAIFLKHVTGGPAPQGSFEEGVADVAAIESMVAPAGVGGGADVNRGPRSDQAPIARPK